MFNRKSIILILVIILSLIGSQTQAASPVLTVYINQYADLNDAISRITASTKTLIIDMPTTLSASASTPATLSIEMKYPGFISQGTYSFNINGPFTAGLYSAFSGTGEITFGSGAIKEVYPEWWGAKGDRATDDSTAIQSAISSLTNGNVILSNVYGVGTGSWVGLQLKSNVNLIGRGNAGFKLLSAPTQYATTQSEQPTLLLGNTISNTIIKNIEINANNINACLLTIHQGTNCRIEENYFHDNTNNKIAVLLQYGNYNYVVGNRFYNVGTGIYAGNPTGIGWGEHYITIAKNRINTTTYTDGIVGVMQYAVIEGNIIQNAGISGISLSSNGTTGESGHHIIVTGNHISGTAAHGIQSDLMAGGGSLNDVTITGNVIENVPGSGLYLIHVYNATITGNRIKNFSTNSSTGGAGIVINNCQYITVSGNVITNAVQNGWGIENLSYRVVGSDYNNSITITGNIISNVASGIWTGVVSSETVTNVIVIGNKVDTTGNDGISFTNGIVNGICSDNIVMSPGRYEYYFDSSLISTVFGNNLIGATNWSGNIGMLLAKKKLVSNTAAPRSGTWAVGDRTINSNPSVGSPKGWVCTVAGTPGTWVSEGNL